MALTCAMLFVANAHAAHGGINVWTSHGPEGANVAALAIDPIKPNALYAGTYHGGVFKSTNGGDTWNGANAGLSNSDVQALAIDPITPTTLYAGTPDGVFKSTDGSATWGATGLHQVFAVAIDPLTPSTLYAGAYDGVFKSTDGGGTWNGANAGLTNRAVRALAIDPITPSTLYVGGYDGVYKSTDGGGPWKAANAGLTGQYLPALAIDPNTPSTLYAATRYGVYKSTDSGTTWNVANAGLTNPDVQALAIDPTTPSTLYAGTLYFLGGYDGGVYKSTDGGGTWKAANAGLTGVSAPALVIDPLTPSTLYVGAAANGLGTGKGGVLKSTEGGGTWSAANAGLTNTNTSAVAIDPISPSTLYAGTDYGVFKSTNAGAAWGATGLHQVFAVAIDPLAPSILYAGASDGVFKSTDGGGTWKAVNAGLPGASEGLTVNALAIDPIIPSTLYAATGSGVYKSTDGAMTWDYNSPPSGSVNALAIDPTAPNTVYAGAGGFGGLGGADFGEVFKSTDGAMTWGAVNTSLIEGPISALAIDPLTPSMLYAAGAGGVFKSTDSGVSWSNAGLANTFVNTLAIDPVEPGTLYASSGLYQCGVEWSECGVFKSTDAGATWKAVTAGLPDIVVRALAIDPAKPGTVYAGTQGGGVFSIQQVTLCIGDCDASGSVTVDEIITLVNIALGNAQPSACTHGIPSGAAVDIALIIQAVNSALSGCPSTDLYVAASGALNGDGSVANPYRRITDAVARARAQRETGAVAAEEEMRIHVAPGTYTGSFDATQLQNHPQYEILPIILNVPRLAVRGATVLVRDARGLPSGSEPQSDTILEPEPLVPDQSLFLLFLVTRTTDGMLGNGVTIDGFVLDGRGAGEGMLFVDRVSGFRISNNLIQHGGIGIITRLASGTIEGNLLKDHAESGGSVSGGSRTQPATVRLHANRAVGNGLHGFMALAIAPITTRLDGGRNTVRPQPVQQRTFDRNDPAEVQNIPDTLAVTLSGNDLSNNGYTGLRLFAVIVGRYQTKDATQPVTAVLTADVQGNTCTGNGTYGIMVEVGFPQRFEPRPFVFTFAGGFEANSFVGNGRTGALFNFTRWNVALGLSTPFEPAPPSLQDYKFAEESTYQVTDANGDVTGFDYDHPVTDPVSGTVLNNTFTLNGLEVPHGTRITPQAVELRERASGAR